MTRSLLTRTAFVALVVPAVLTGGLVTAGTAVAEPPEHAAVVDLPDTSMAPQYAVVLTDPLGRKLK